MVLKAFGISFHTAPLNIREAFVFKEQSLSEIVNELLSQALAEEVLILSTCNRTEFYCVGKQSEEIYEWLINRQNFVKHHLDPFIYTFENEAVVKHAMRVAAGLDSMILGEAEIFGQIKTAFSVANRAGGLKKILNRLFQTTFSVAKQVRTQTEIGVNPISIASLTVEVAGRIFSDLKNSTVLLVGTGVVMQLVAKHLKKLGVTRFLIANRTLNHAKALAKAVEGLAFPLSSLGEIVSKADIVITGTGSLLPILGKGMVERAIKQRKRCPILMLDLSVPRNIEPEVGLLEDVYLYCLDDLKQLGDENRKKREQSVLHAEHIIHYHVAQFMRWYQAQSTIQVLRDFREKCDTIREENLAQALTELKAGKSPELVLEKSLLKLSNRLIHSPTVRLREIIESGDKERLDKMQELLL